MPKKHNKKEIEITELNRILRNIKTPSHTKEYLSIMENLNRLRKLMNEW